MNPCTWRGHPGEPWAAISQGFSAWKNRWGTVSSRTREPVNPRGRTRGGRTIQSAVKIFSKNPYKLRLVRASTDRVLKRMPPPNLEYGKNKS